MAKSGSWAEACIAVMGPQGSRPPEEIPKHRSKSAEDSATLCSHDALMTIRITVQCGLGTTD